jgi:HSP20 family protein
MDRIFEMLAPPMPAKLKGPARDRLEKTENGHRLVASVPGLAAEDIELTIDEHTLEIRASHEPAPPEGFEAVRRERRGYVLERRYRFAGPVDVEKIEATLSDGLLRVELPAREAVGPKRITIERAA